MEHEINIKEEIIKLIKDDENLEISGQFMVLWSLFEKKFCNCDANKSKLKTIAEKYNTLFDKDILKQVFEGMVKRYKNEECFNNLRFRRDNYKNEVRGILDNNNATDEEKLRAILYIIYRYRNNLAHGEKNIETLIKQRENFEMSYQVLIELLKIKTA